MSSHEGISCDSCLKSNFSGRRYKCLICYDYDLCWTCQEAGATTRRHTNDHAMQCILTPIDMDVFYGGEPLMFDQPQSFTCPYCSKLGLTQTSLQQHISAQHTNPPTVEVVCPICAATPGGDPNHVTDDLAGHLAMEHRTPRDLTEQQLETLRHGHRLSRSVRELEGARARRQRIHAALSAYSATEPRDTVDPIAELLSQLSSVRDRTTAAYSVSSQLQQLEAQLLTTRQQIERLPRRQAEPVYMEPSMELQRLMPGGLTMAEVVKSGAKATGQSTARKQESQFLLAKENDGDVPEDKRLAVETDRADRSLFVQELLLSSLSHSLQLADTSWPDTGPERNQTQAESCAIPPPAATPPPAAIPPPAATQVGSNTRVQPTMEPGAVQSLVEPGVEQSQVEPRGESTRVEPGAKSSLVVKPAPAAPSENCSIVEELANVSASFPLPPARDREVSSSNSDHALQVLKTKQDAYSRKSPPKKYGYT